MLYLKTDNKLVLDSDDDFAHLKWGDSWRMPTLEEVKELVNNCVFWRIYGEIEGVQAVGTNHNSIFYLSLIKNSMERLRDKTEPFPMNTRIYTFHPQTMQIY